MIYFFLSAELGRRREFRWRAETSKGVTYALGRNFNSQPSTYNFQLKCSHIFLQRNKKSSNHQIIKLPNQVQSHFSTQEKN